MAIRLTTVSAAAAAALLLAPLASHATPLLFTLDDPANQRIVTFELDSNPVPTMAFTDAFMVAVTDAKLDGAPDPGLGNMSFADSVGLGGLSSGDDTVSAYGDQIFGGGTSAGTQPAPYFYSGTFNLVDSTTFADETLTVADISAAPEPSTWALMIAGLSVTGLALRRHSPQNALG